MNLDKIIQSRHSIREYKKKDVDYKLIGQILEAATYAPSSGNIQNWRFIIIKDQEKRGRIAKASLNQLWMSQAPVHIAVCYDEKNAKTLYPKEYESFSIQNTAIASTIIMLKATELNLGTCWVAVTDPSKISGILRIPDYFRPAVIITLGYPAGYYKKTKRTQIDKLSYLEDYQSRPTVEGYSYSRKAKGDATIFPIDKYPRKLGSKIKTRL